MTRSDVLLLLQHPPVYTFGKRLNADAELRRKREREREREGHGVKNREREAMLEEMSDIVGGLSRDALASVSGADVVDVGRGGQVTFHGPGQCIFYPIVNLRRRVGIRSPSGPGTDTEEGGSKGIGRIGARAFVESLESALIAASVAAGVSNATSLSHQGSPGVYVPYEVSRNTTEPNKASPSSYRKLGSVGVKVSQGVTSHGAALNVSTDLRYFEWIVSCGAADVKQTSIMHELNKHQRASDYERGVDMRGIENAFVCKLQQLLAYDCVEEIDACQLGLHHTSIVG